MSGRRRQLSSEEIKRIKERNAEKQKEKSKIKWHWSLTIFLIGFILGIISFTVLSSTIVISKLEIIIIFMSIATVSALLQFKYFSKKNVIAATMKKTMPFFIFYNIIGVGFSGLFLFFILNNTVASDEITHEYYDVAGMDPDYKIYRWGDVVFLLENDAYADDVYLRALPYNDYFTSKNKPVMEYDFQKGLFGYKIKVAHRLVEKKPSSNE